MTTVHINEIDSVDECQVRLSLDKDMVEHYAEVYRNGGALPHLAIYQVGKRLVLVDGYHRLAAAAVAEKARVPIEIVGTGAIEEAREWALTANQKHGLPLRKEDRIRAIELATKLPKYKDASNVALAELLGMSEATVRRLRGDTVPAADEPTKNQALRPPTSSRDEVEHLSVRNQVDGPPEGWAIEPEPEQNDHTYMVTEKPVEVPKVPVRRLGKDGKWRAAAGRKPKAEVPGRAEMQESEKRVRRVADDLGARARVMAKENPHIADQLQFAVKSLRVTAAGIAGATPVECPRCNGKACQACNQHGWITQAMLVSFNRASNGA